MCHDTVNSALPAAGIFAQRSGLVSAFVIGPDSASHKIAILPDIYGCNAFYRGVATKFSLQGAQVFLVNPFAELGELAEATREAGFERRHKLRDAEFIARLIPFIAQEKITAVVGFCLGGLYVFELARQNVGARLVSFYGFPQGLVNADALAAPLSYLESVTRPHVCLFGTDDPGIPIEHVRAVEEIATRNAAIKATVFQGSGHGFLNDLDHDDEHLHSNAKHALALCEAEIFSSGLASG